MRRLTKKLEAEILKLYHAYWDAYLKGDFKTFASYLDENTTVFGTAQGEVFTSKQEAVKFYKATADQMTGKADFRKRKISAKAVGDTVVINEESDLYALIDDAWTFYGHARITAIFEQKGNTWKLVHQHGSFPDSRTEAGEQIAVNKVKEENVKLKEAIKRRTIDLENKNRELEIETALEKVRSVAMGMKGRADMLKICKTISLQLASLGLKEIRNVQTAIFNVPAGTYMNYEYYAKHKKTFITETLYTNHKVARAFAAKMLKGKGEVSVTHIKGKEKIKEWLNYQKSTNVFIDTYLNKATSLTYYWYSLGPVALGISTYLPLSKEDLQLFQRFLKVFELAYRRYLDIEKAEAQAREAQIEAALERIRAASLAMQDSSALGGIIYKLYGELTKLDAKLDRCFIMIVNPDNRGITWWMAGQEGLLAENGFFVPMNQHPSHLMYLDYCKKRKKKWTYLFEGKEKRDWDRFGFTKTELAKLPEPIKAFMAAAKKVHLSGSSDQFGLLVTGSFEPLPEEQQEIISRFTIAFNQAYVRFLDLQKAEAQAREAEIQLALERVRARSLAMHKTDELQQVVNMVAQQLLQMGIDMDGGVFIAINDEVKNDLPIWAAAGAADYVQKVTIPFLDRQTFTRLHDAIIRRQPFYTEVYSKKDKNEFLNHLFRHHPWNQNSEQRKKELLAREGGYARSVVINQHTSIGITNHHGKKFTDAENEILRRFGSVLEQSYTRFLDLQKAEAQAREAQIEAALERVRSRSMAMHKSEELSDLSLELVKQVQALGVATWFCAFNIYDDDPQGSLEWGSNGQGVFPRYRTPREGVFLRYYEAGQRGETLLINEIGKEECPAHYEYLCSLPGVGDQLLKMKEAGISFPTSQIDHVAFFKYGYIIFITYEPVPETHDIFKRFAKVFEQTYTRFLDLQKAEAQAREAQVEAALERVRSRSMGMQKSEELRNVVQVIYEQFVHLGIEIFGADFRMDYREREDWHIWAADRINSFPSQLQIPYFDHPYWNAWQEAKRNGLDSLNYTMGLEEKNSFVLGLSKHIPDLSAEALEIVLNTPGYSVSNVFLQHVALSIDRFKPEPFSEADNAILIRFAKVFEQTYTRFLDLQKAEVQAREAQVEAALERVRSRSLAMHSSGELGDVVTVVLNNLTELGYIIEQGSAAHLVIFSEGTKDFVQWSADPALPHPVRSFIPYTDLPILTEFWDARQKGHDFFARVYPFDEKNTWFKFAFEHSDLKHIPGELKKLLLESETYAHSIAIEKNSAIIINSITGNQLSENQIDILRRFSKVFEQAYVRFLDLQRAEAQAREAQIEAALERIRGKVTSMQESSELLDIVVSMRREFVALSHEAGYFWYMRWLPDKYEKAMTSGDGTRIGMVMTLPRHIHGDIKLVADWEKSDEPALVFPMDVDTAVDYVDKMIKLGDFQQVDPQAPTLDDIRHIGGLTFIMARTTHGEIGYSLTGVVPNPPEEDVNTLIRFAAVFDLAYRRFEDLKEAERRNRETQIELALERVRSRTMAMHKSAELKEVIKVVLEQFVHLNINVKHAGFYIDYKANDDMHIWLADPNIEPFYATFPYFDTPTWNSFRDAKAKGKNFFTDLLDFEEKNRFYRFLFKFFEVPEDARKFYLECKGLAVSTVLLDNVGLYIENFDAEPYSDEENNILMRFGKVFQQTYTRFLDLQKAEAQAKEAQIEAALERVRSRTMAMQKSDELLEAGELLCSEMTRLGITSLTSGYVLMDADERIGWNYTPNPGTGKIMPAAVGISHVETAEMQRVLECWKNKAPFSIIEMEEEQTIRHQTFVAERSINFPLSAKELLAISPKKLVLHNFNFKEGYILIVGGEKLTDDQIEIMLRFTNVFQQTYTRFLDLQRAEAQAKEARIEAALEKVRSRTMAMQKSGDLNSAAADMFKEIQALGMQPWGCGFNIFDSDEKAVTQYMSLADGGISPPFRTPLTEDPFFIGIYNARQRKDELLVMESAGESLAETYRYMFGLPGSGEIFGDLENAGFEMPKYQITHCAYFSQGYLVFITYQQVTEAHDIFKRFAKVFDQTYTRFLDLQKAEAQARESQIEAALERVRSRSMAMHNSKELGEVAKVMFNQMKLLGGELFAFGIVLCDKNENVVEQWHGLGEGDMMTPFHVPVDLDYIHRYRYDQWKGGVELFSIEIPSDYIARHFELMFALPSVKMVMDDLKSKGIELAHPSWEIDYGASFRYGYLLVSSLQPYAEDKIFPRFAKVFEQAYTRFLDLQKAEAQTREAQIEAALEKVRSRTLAMQKSDELAGTAAVLFQQLISLGIEPNRLYIILIKENTADMEAWVTDEDGSKVSMGFTGNYRKNETLLKMYEGWSANKGSLVIDMQGEELQQYFHYLHDELNVPFKGGLEQKRRVQHIAYFSHGLIGMASPEEQPAATMQLLERFAAVFNLTFTRFNDLQIAEAHARQAELDLIAIKEAKQKAEEALTELQATQKQLIQSEKMASLGELTAGIAHEIQNPLNFVNNFSEVSKELLDEMKEELEKGNMDEAREIMNDVIQNLEKINHHGKRADGIVKGMLQHSRSSSGQKELTDINALCDEYLRLAYHGLRAKDKSFNAKFEADLDAAVGKISLLPQDMGRVILNLINNAFYAVSERKKADEPGYEPIVTVNTLKKGNTVEIKVTDNGTGITQKVLHKIFQPFFTTKPTGQGTGLGLSLSYDIVTKGHGGELKVETKEGEGTAFIILLPA